MIRRAQRGHTQVTHHNNAVPARDVYHKSQVHKSLVASTVKCTSLRLGFRIHASTTASGDHCIRGPLHQGTTAAVADEDVPPWEVISPPESSSPASRTHTRHSTLHVLHACGGEPIMQRHAIPKPASASRLMARRSRSSNTDAPATLRSPSCSSTPVALVESRHVTRGVALAT